MLNPLNLRIYITLLCVALLLNAPSFAEEKIKPVKLYEFGVKGEIRSFCHRGKEFLMAISYPYSYSIANTGMDCERSSPPPSSKNEAQ